MSRRRSDFGSIRRLPSGRWQARHRDTDGEVRSAPHTFETCADASAYLAQLRTDIRRGERADPMAGRISLRVYAEAWLDQRRVRGAPLAPRTKILYSGLLANHILPVLGNFELRRLDTATVRSWHRRLAGAEGPGQNTAAKSYRLLHAICATAVTEEEIRRNPCVLSGAGQEPQSVRPALTVQDVEALAEVVPARWRALVLVAAYGGLRFGELAALRRDHLDLERGVVMVDHSLAELPGGVRHEGPPKSRAGQREVAIPPHILDDVRAHVDSYAEPGPSGLVFVGPKGGPLRSANFGKAVWRPAVGRVGLGGVHFHDLRGFAATMAAISGATTAELMRRLGHASPDMALRYQRATAARDAAVAWSVSRLVSQGRGVDPPSR